MGKSALDEWIEEGMARGEARGEARGRVLAGQNSLLRLLVRKFGTVPEETRARVHAIEDDERLNVLMERVIDARDIESVGI